MKWQCADFHENAGTGSKQYAGFKKKRGLSEFIKGQYAFPIHDASKAVIGIHHKIAKWRWLIIGGRFNRSLSEILRRKCG